MQRYEIQVIRCPDARAGVAISCLSRAVSPASTVQHEGNLEAARRTRLKLLTRALHAHIRLH